MPNPFLRPSERDAERTGPTPGVCVRTADGRRFFFAGGTKDLALSYARHGLGDLLDDSARVEWGFAVENPLTKKSTWSCQEVLRPGDERLKLKCD